MNYSLPTHEFHPELGYLCPSRRVRQNVRVGLAAAAFGVITGMAAAMALFPRHGADPARSEYLLAVAPSGPASDLAPLPAPNPSVALAGAPAGTAARISTGASPKQLAPAAPVTPAARAGDELSAAVQAPPARATPVATIERGTAAVSGHEHVRAEAIKRTKRTKANTRPRAREPYPTDAFAASPFSFETRRFSDGTRSARRRDWGSTWSW
jgi:hypothetical protein